MVTQPTPDARIAEKMAAYYNLLGHRFLQYCRTADSIMFKPDSDEPDFAGLEKALHVPNATVNPQHFHIRLGADGLKNALARGDLTELNQQDMLLYGLDPYGADLLKEQYAHLPASLMADIDDDFTFYTNRQGIVLMMPQNAFEQEAAPPIHMAPVYDAIPQEAYEIAVAYEGDADTPPAQKLLPENNPDTPFKNLDVTVLFAPEQNQQQRDDGPTRS